MCGIIGLVGDKPVSYLIYKGLFAVQHRGQSSAGKLTYDGNIHMNKDAGLVRDVFNDSKKIFTPGNLGIGHTRYSTAGMDDIESLKHNAQPEYVINPFLAGVHNGNIYNGYEMRRKTKRTPRTECDIQWLLLPLADYLYGKKIDVDTIFEAAEWLMPQVKGSYSALFITDSGENPLLFAITDPRKIRPLVLGENTNYKCFASETRVFKKINFRYIEDVPGGSAVVIDKEGQIHEKRICKKKEMPCMFEFVYFAKPDSRINGRSIHNVRVEIGRRLAKEAPVDADIICPVPESGRRYAIGFSRESGIPLDEGLMKDKSERSFIQQTQDKREEIVAEGLSFIRSVLKGKKVVLIDDSIVRGTNMRKIVSGIREAGAKEVHVRIGCPPLLAPCYLGIDMRSKREFIARNPDGSLKDWDQIAKEIGADSLAYISHKSLKESIGFDICTGCINFPDGYPPEMREDALQLFNRDLKDRRAYEIM